MACKLIDFSLKMFNVYSYEKRLLTKLQKEKELARSVQNIDIKKARQERLYENYNKRITEFILHMEKQPIKINRYESPLENTGRIYDPSKFKGKPRIVIREYKTHRERLLVFFIQENLKYSSIHSPKQEFNHEIPAKSKIFESSKEKLFFNPNNKIRRADQLKTKILNDFDSKLLKKRLSISKLNPQKP